VGARWPALRVLTFAQRGELLAAMSNAIHAQREALIEMGRLSGGNTKFDIDGATGTPDALRRRGQDAGADGQHRGPSPSG
jgi:3,4-dehydroadipyl-CoA semialdehyde dehydrogenase